MNLNIMYRNGTCQEIVGVEKLRVSADSIEVFTHQHTHEEASLSTVASFDLYGPPSR